MLKFQDVIDDMKFEAQRLVFVGEHNQVQSGWSDAAMRAKLFTIGREIESWVERILAAEEVA